jgi:hypothetical protein
MPQEKNYSQRLDAVEKAVKSLAKGDNVARPPTVPALPAAVLAQENIFKRHPYVVALCALFVTLLSLVFGSGVGPKTVGLWIDERIGKKLEDPIRRLGNIENGLTETNAKLGLIYDLLKDWLKTAAKLKPADFSRSLPKTADALRAATVFNVPSSPEVENEIRKNLLSVDSNAPGYWPTAALFITYQTAGLRPLQPDKLPNCVDSEPTPARLDIIAGPHTASWTYVAYDNCRITLDSPRDTDRINTILLNSSPRLVFRHCYVVYGGGEINLVLQWKGYRAVGSASETPQVTKLRFNAVIQFQDCSFEFLVPGIPPPTGKGITSALLAQNGAKRTLPPGAENN